MRKVLPAGKLTRNNSIHRYPIGSVGSRRRCRRPRRAITFVLTVPLFESSRYTGSGLFGFPQFHFPCHHRFKKFIDFSDTTSPLSHHIHHPFQDFHKNISKRRRSDKFSLLLFFPHSLTFLLLSKMLFFTFFLFKNIYFENVHFAHVSSQKGLTTRSSISAIYPQHWTKTLLKNWRTRSPWKITENFPPEIVWSRDRNVLTDWFFAFLQIQIPSTFTESERILLFTVEWKREQTRTKIESFRFRRLRSFASN